MPHKGYKHPESFKIRMRAIVTGRKHSEETKKKISNSLKGRIVSEEQKRKISAFHKGKTLSDETKRKVALSLRKYYETHTQPWAGKPLSEERKKAISASKVRYGWRGYIAREAKERDDYTCQICGLRDPEIVEVDHIKPRSKFPEIVSRMDNIQTICPNCHRRKTNQELRKQYEHI